MEEKAWTPHGTHQPGNQTLDWKALGAESDVRINNETQQDCPPPGRGHVRAQLSALGEQCHSTSDNASLGQLL